jgi:tripartite-type tricarboxylate transporter receptor subunit TctC
VIVHPSSPAKTLAELIALAKASKVAYATPGSGTTPHLTGEHLFRVIAASDAQAIHFRGAGPAAAAVVGNEPGIGSMAFTAAMPQVKAGKVRAIAISSSTRHPTLPDVPTFVELGYPQIQDYTWVGLFAPTGTPPEIVRRLNEAVQRAIEAPEVRERLAALAFDPVGGPPERVAEYVKSEVVRWAKVVKDTGAKLE